MSASIIDLRSDTVTKPSAAMREAMMKAEVGDDVFGEDPTVNLLQQKVADLLGKEAALYVPSGTQANQICLKVHTQPGDEVIMEKGCHLFNYETGALALLSSIQPHVVEGVLGVMNLSDIKKAVRPKLYYMPRSAAVAIENTHNRAGGTIYPIETIREIHDFTRAEKMGFHLDGARLWNACVETGIAPKEYASYFDSVSVCLSKGLGAPVGSVIAGSKDFIERARKFRKIFGGGMRQAGILAAAGIYALDHNRERLKEDHAKLRYLADELTRISSLSIDREAVQTNILLIGIEKTGKTQEEVLALLKSKGVLLTLGNWMSVRAVTHLDVSMEQVKQAAGIFHELFD
ncbi:MAG: low-specificity L-threonine aldolase [Ignavibacteriae bacterium]|nr:low-specificity L-threonine aldolase [Ignavibacteriota bacterium]